MATHCKRRKKTRSYIDKILTKQQALAGLLPIPQSPS